MNYRQLLDPKNFEKSKKKPPNHGPQQSRKPAPEATGGAASLRKFDPKALLNPKAAGQSQPSMESTDHARQEDGAHGSANTENDTSSEQPGISSMIERRYNVSNREAPPPQKRKSEALDDAEHEESLALKKSKPNLTMNGGVMGDYLKSERQKGAAASGPSAEPIDLTNDDEGQSANGTEDDVVFVSETVGYQSQEVCLGRLTGTANAHRIPRPPKSQTGVLGKEMWPQSRINFRRKQAPGNFIELFDSQTGGATAHKFGFVDAKTASALCPLMDGRSANKLNLKMFIEPYERKEGETPGSRISRFLPLSVVLYAPREKVDLIGTFLSQKQMFLLDPRNPGRNVEYYNPQRPKVLGASKAGPRKPQSSQSAYAVSRTEEEMVRETSDMFDKLVNRSDLAEMEADPSLILTPLMSHQKQALKFLMDHERTDQDEANDDSNFSLWKSRTTNKGNTWYNIISNHEVKQKPDPVRGGILADMMGLGKTLSILALLTQTLEEARAFGRKDASPDLEFVERNAKATLIICPKSVLSNWTEQVRAHTPPNRLKVYVYHGPARTQDLDELANYNVVLTTYSTAASEFSDKEHKRNALASIQWFRIVLDEAHQIRTQSTQVSQACCALFAESRWAVTGTPVQNRLDDLGALIKFLRVKPFDDGISWGRHILAPFKSGNPEALQHLRLIVDGITLRRQKDKIGLTARREHRVRLNLSDDEMVTYSQFSKQSNMQLRVMLKDGGRLKGKSYAHVLKSLTRLRMICAHNREMLHEDDLKELDGLTAGTAIDLGDEPDGTNPDDTFVTEKQAYDTLHMMSESEVDMCINCERKIGDKKVDPDAVADDSDESDSEDESDEDAANNLIGYLTPCYHLICPRCKDKHVKNTVPELTDDGHHVCSYCESYVRYGLFELNRSTLKNILDSRNNISKKKAKWDESTYSGPHTKVKALVNDLKASARESAQLPPEEPPIRSVVFSGWTTYLDLIEHALDENNINYVRIDGTMSIKARSAAMATFKSDPTVTVILVSVKAGGQGVNFTAANRVYMMEPQFNPGTEQQAIDRVHRLGQPRDVDITHYIMKETVEEKILDLQERKDELASLTTNARGKLEKGETVKKKMERLRDLFK